MAKLVIVGGGAAGMLAAIVAADRGHLVTVVEKNEKLGKKLYITGKGRCNITNACAAEEFFQNVNSNSKFLYSSYYGFDNQSAMDFFEELGLKLKTERGNRVFPVSDHSSDVIKALSDGMKKRNVKIMLNSEVEDVIVNESGFSSVVLTDGSKISADACFIATGGISYPSTGSTGDGFRFAKKIGHTVTELYPSLVALKTEEPFVKNLEGLSLKNVEVMLTKHGAPKGKKNIYSAFGEMLFTGRGVSGPVILSASSYAAKFLAKGEQLTLHIDFKPALTYEQLDARIIRDFEEMKNRQFKNSLGNLLPVRLIDVIISQSGISPDKPVNSIKKEERRRLVELLKDFTLTITESGSFNEAVITKGGVKTDEINKATMESKLVKGVYFIGEVIDCDAMTGGFNLQIAWSTAYAAASQI